MPLHFSPLEFFIFFVFFFFLKVFLWKNWIIFLVTYFSLSLSYYSLLLPPAEVNFNNFHFSPSALLLFFFLLASTHTATAAALFLNFFFFPHFLSLIINQFNEAFFLERKKQRSFDVLCIPHISLSLNFLFVWTSLCDIEKERERMKKGIAKSV